MTSKTRGFRRWVRRRTTDVATAKPPGITSGTTATTPTAGWDVFVCHASEDKDAVARPIAQRLQMAGLLVWLDEFELKVGDSLLARINDGLSSSRFGIVIFSPTFLAKKWGPQELAGLFTLEQPGEKRILPIWHQMDAAELMTSYPILADRVALRTSNGIDPIVEAVIELVLNDPEIGTSVAARLVRQVAVLVEQDDRAALIDFICQCPALLSAIGRADGTQPTVLSNTFPRINAPHLLVGVPKRTTGVYDWTLLVLLGTQEKATIHAGLPTDAVTRAVEEISTTRRELSSGQFSQPAGSLNSRFVATIMIGRRHLMNDEDKSALASLADELVSVQIRTYDSLLERAIDVLRPPEHGRSEPR